jgi:hypothetical protein
MTLLRRYCWPGGTAALLLFALQFAAAFGHVHIGHVDVEPTAASHLAAIAGGTQDDNDGGHHGARCDICTAIQAFASFVAPAVTATVPAPLAVAIHFAAPAHSPEPAPPTLAFNARGPPHP